MSVKSDEPSEFQLRREISLAAAGATVFVKPGEHFGPFVFDRPIRLVAQNAGTALPVLVVPRGPIAVVRSPKVVWENLEFLIGNGDYRGIDFSIVYAPSCKPEMKNVQLKGRMEDMGIANVGGGWDLPVIIDLGELNETERFRMPMTISVPGPTFIKSGLNNMTVEPAQLSQAGEHRVQLVIGQGYLIKGMMLAGQIVLDSQGESKTVWVIGHVLAGTDYIAKSQKSICLTSQNGRKFNFSQTMVLGKDQFLSEPAAAQLPAAQAYFTKHVSSDVWSIIQTSSQPVVMKINGQPLLFAHRTLLNGGEVIEVAGLKLTVDPKEKSPILELPGQVNFGKLSVVHSSGAKLRLKNVSNNNWEGQLRSTVNWIQSPAEKIICPRGQQIDISLQLTQEAARQPVGNLQEYGALVLEGGKENWLINAALEVDISGPLLVINPRVLSFGKVSDPTQVVEQKVILINTGSMDWQGSISTVDWLEADKNTLIVPAGGQVELLVKLKQSLSALHEGLNSETKAVILKGQGIDEYISCTIEYARPKAVISVEPKMLAFGMVDNWRNARVILTLTNSGERDWRGRIACNEDWLELLTSGGQSINEIKIAAHDEIKLLAQLKASAWALPPDKQTISANAVRIFGEEKVEITFAASLLLQKPKIEFKPDSLDFEIKEEPGSWKKSFSVVNNGKVEWVGNIISTVSWLVASPDVVQLRPGEKADVQVSVSLSEANRLYAKKQKPTQVFDAIEVKESGNVITQIGVSIFIIEAIKAEKNSTAPDLISAAVTKPTQPPEVIASPPARLREMDFGTISRADTFPLSKEFTVENSSALPMEGSVSCDLPWITVEPARFTISPKGQILFTVFVAEQALNLGSEEFQSDQAVMLGVGGRKTPIQVKFKVEKAVIVPQGEILDFGLVSRKMESLPCISVPVKNLLVWSVDVQAKTSASWLTVVPEKIRCPGKQDVQVLVSLTKEALSFPPGVKIAESVLVILCGQQRKEYHVKLEMVDAIKPAVPANEPAKSTGSEKVKGTSPLSTGETAPGIPEQKPPYSIDFDEIKEWSGDAPFKLFRLTNSSAKPLDGKATTDDGLTWLIVEPGQFSIAPGGFLDIKVSLTKSVLDKPKKYKAENAVKIEYGGKALAIQVVARVQSHLASAGKSVSIPISGKPSTAKTGKLKDALALDLAKDPEQAKKLSSVLDFGEIKNWSDLPKPRSIALANSSSQMIKGSISIEVPWLKVEPAQFECLPGQQVILKIELSDGTRGLTSRAKPYKAEDAICIQTDSQKYDLRASVVIQVGR